MALKPCLDCGRLAKGSRCNICLTIRNQTNPYRDADWRRLSQQVTARDGACVRCGSARYLNAHHVIPRRHGGPDSVENLVSLRVICHGKVEAARRQEA